MSDTVTLALIAAIPPTLVAAGSMFVGRRNGKGIEKVHVLVNSQMTAALKRIDELENKLGLSKGEAIPGAPILAAKTDHE